MIKIYHNNKCSKSRQCLFLLEQKSSNIEIIDYVKNPLSFDEIENLLIKMKIPAIDLIRKNEPLWKELKNDNLSEEQLIKLMVENPKLIQRPIVVLEDRAFIARPPELVLEWLQD